MRTFVFYSEKAKTTGKIKDDLMQSGRMDIVIHSIIATFFLSHKLRKDVEMHLVFDGPPNPPQHLIFRFNEETPISKKDVAGLISKMLYKSEKGKIKEIFPGCFIEKKHFEAVISELKEKNKKIFLLDLDGEKMENLKEDEINNSVFILGDDDGIPKSKLKTIKHMIDKKISIGPEMYFSSQTIIILNNFLDKYLNNV
ncbi:hypothetical protein AUJ10_01450 [Candidatus Pacearchaeota archaeon CG1_02_31_27]|nr:MAG: hypothetical protein AUJ10_01450 [Candidatus Pacearchaeota archaeon CG1_02_31_27]PIN91998.1 MAG: hypothetical protein COU55_02965 [Candidatus Pacearchaeota archaeon CG10_big_fil_rev_8_21_14_0_10_31_59]PIZ81161.1 MAG: hypothetical protein COX99_00225 [Candidatus Pacearchaeota archaeon CG_4_10_14_0_2_um_filter_31_10]